MGERPGTAQAIIVPPQEAGSGHVDMDAADLLRLQGCLIRCLACTSLPGHTRELHAGSSVSGTARRARLTSVQVIGHPFCIPGSVC